MDVLQVHPGTVLREWSTNADYVGLECIHYWYDELVRGADQRIHHTHVGRPSGGVDLATIDNLEYYDAEEESSLPPRKQPARRRLFQLLRRLFPRRGWKERGAPKHHTFGFPTNKSKDKVKRRLTTTSDDNSTSAKTMTTCSSFHTLDSEGSVIAELAADHKVETSNFLELFKLFAEYDLENDQNGKAKEEIEAVLPDASRVCRTPKTASSCCGNETNDLLVPGEVPLMVERLLRTGVCRSREDFEFVPDKVSKEVAHLFADEKKEDEAEQDENVSHVKTGIWEVVTFEDDGTSKAPFYVVTGVSMTDRVDTKKLRNAIFKGQSSGRRPKLHLAPTSVGETLAGYKSGTMAPICHSKNMKLYLEETILKGDREHRILCGSGMFGKCLSIAEDKFMEVAQSNSEGVELVSLIQKKKGIT